MLLQFFWVNQNYIKYLRCFDEKVPIKNRPYIEVFKNKKYTYFAPIYSAKPKHKNYFTNNTFFRICDWNNKYIGLIRFSNMIPVPTDCIKEINYNSSDRLYQEFYYILQHQNQIIKKAQYTYKNYDKLKNICVNFKLIEKSMYDYESIKNKPFMARC